MIKFLFKLPNNVLLKYLDNNIENELNPQLFTDDVLDMLAISDITLTVDLIEQYPIFFTNQKMVERIIKEFPFFIKRLNPEQITDAVIRNLILTNYILDEEDINKFPFLLDNLLLSNIALAHNPALIFKLPNLTNHNLQFIKDQHLVPTYDDYMKHPILRNDNLLVKKSFEKDPSCIVFMNSEILDYYVAQGASNRGFLATEKDLILNPLLGKYKPIMEPAIMQNPALVSYIEFTCFLSEQCLDYALDNFEITVDTLKEHPNLCRSLDIMNRFPQFSIYSAYRTQKDKMADIVSCLEGHNIDKLRQLPFLKKVFGSKTDVDDKITLVNLLYEDIPTEQIKDQKSHFAFLEYLIDGVCNIRYHEQKDKFEFGDIASLHNDIVLEFIKAEDKNSLVLLAERLSHFTGYELSKDEMKQQIFRLYNLFLSRHGSLLLSDTNVLCNMILNAHRNSFFKQERSKIILDLTKKLSLADKKKRVLENGTKFLEITELIKNRQYDELGIDEEKLRGLVREASLRFKNNRRLRKDNIFLDESVIEYLEQLFLQNGTLNVSDLPCNIPLESAKYICNNYEKVKLHLVDHINLENLTINKQTLAMNAHNFVAISKHQNFTVLASLILSLEEDKLKSILSNGEIISELKPLLPYVNFFDEFSLNTFINILINYPKVKQRILATNQYYSLTSKFRDIVTLANAYSSIDDIHLFALTPKVVKILGEEKSMTYLNFYLEMLNKTVCYIPPVYINDNNLIFYSGNYSDQDKLLIGKRYKDSCIDLDNIAGVKTFTECLNGKSGDVILVKTKDTKDFAGRILLIRRGNVVQLMVKYEDSFSLDVYKKIANEIIKQAQLVDDNIDFVVINHKAILEWEDEVILDKIDFVNRFPHADLSQKVVLLASSQKELNIDNINQSLDFDLEPKYQYSKFRKRISYNPTEDEISRIKALNILLQDDIVLKEELSRDFEPFYIEDYNKVICSEEWYIAQKITGELEEVILPHANEFVRKEFEEMRNMILVNDLKFNFLRR